MELKNILIILLIIISIIDINYYNIYIIPILMILLSFISLTKIDKQFIYLLGITLLLLTTKFLYNKDKFSNFIMIDDIISQTKYCLPLKNGKCPNNLNVSLNDPKWCCMGACYCYQKTPPTTCQKKYPWGQCPYKEQNTSLDDPNMCCFGKNCLCGIDKTVPPITTCSGKPRYNLEEEEEEENENGCPCNKDLVCTKVIKEIPATKPKTTYTPTIPNECQAYINTNSNLTTSTSSNQTNTTSTNISNSFTPNNIKIPSPNTNIYKVENPLDPLIYDSSKYWDSRKHL